MSDLIIQSSSVLQPLPALPIAVRPATHADLSFIDSLQKLHTKQVGWMPTKQLEGKIAAGHVLIAEEKLSTDCADDADLKAKQIAPVLSAQSAKSAVPSPLGYCIGHDQYFKRDDVGIIYQMNVVPGRQRSLIGATLLRAMFERAAYGCRLFCCWCAQDIAANYFWESMGFAPLAFRTGGKVRMKKASNVPADSSFIPHPSSFSARVHIFWQKRIVSGDSTTPYWFPSQTSSGAIREDRLVLPIPPGVRWSDPMPRVLPRQTMAEGAIDEQKRLPAPRRSRKTQTATVRRPVSLIASGGLRIGNAAQAIVTQPAPQSAKAKREKAPRTVAKNDPQMIAAARELRDRWLEKVNRGEYLPQMRGKYHVCRSLISDEPDGNMPHRKFLAA